MHTSNMTRIFQISRNIALYLGIIFLIFWAIRGYCYTLELEVRSPEIIELEKRAYDRESERCVDRVDRGVGSDKDIERSLEHKFEKSV